MTSFARRAGIVGVIALLAWVSCAVWNSVKPLPPGTHVASLPARLTEFQVDFIDDLSHPGALLERQLQTVGRAEQTIVLDQSPLAHELADALLLRKRQRPNLKIMLVTDPRDEVYGGTSAQTLSALERAGIIVARVRLERLRDSDPLYSSLWRLCVDWWSDPFDEKPAGMTLTSALRRRNLKADGRQLLIADDGAGGWTSIVMTTASAGAPASADAGLEIRGHLARDIVVSELRIAAWSTDDDRLPAAPPVPGRGVGTIDARFLAEGAILLALRDAISAAGSGDSIKIAVQDFGERQLVNALLRAARRGARVQLVLDSGLAGTRASAGELMNARTGGIEVRWRTRQTRGAAGYAVIQHRGDVWVVAGSANFTRRNVGDLDLEADIELHMPARAGPARAAGELFAKEWLSAGPYAVHEDDSAESYWRYRLAEFTGSAMFQGSR